LTQIWIGFPSSQTRQHAVAIQDQDDAAAAGTVINFRLPKHHKKRHTKEGPGGKNRKQNRHAAVVLVHGFAGDGIMTWWRQVNALARISHVDVYVPDLIHFGGSTSPSPDRSATFQARCLAAALRKLGVVERCTVVGFSYGGLVEFEMAAAFPELVRSIVVSGAVPAYTAAMNDALLERFGVGSLTELMLPDSVGGVMVLFSTAFYKKPWLPRRLLSDFLEVITTVLLMFLTVLLNIIETIILLHVMCLCS
jgi:pimeloyl-ACP methyl ester carboxylesterase